MNVIPDEIEKALKNDFKLNEHFLFCQVGTQSQGFPHVRTMRLYGIEDEHGLIFVTRDTSRKYADLKNNAYAAICILHPGYHLQLQAECTVKLVDFHNEPELCEKYWEMVKTEVKKIYHDDYVSDLATI